VRLEALGSRCDLTDFPRLAFDPVERLADDQALFGTEIETAL
jgi:hypothetical protein